jgi:hypothetical protein
MAIVPTTPIKTLHFSRNWSTLFPFQLQQSTPSPLIPCLEILAGLIKLRTCVQFLVLCSILSIIMMSFLVLLPLLILLGTGTLIQSAPSPFTAPLSQIHHGSPPDKLIQRVSSDMNNLFNCLQKYVLQSL